MLARVADPALPARRTTTPVELVVRGSTCPAPERGARARTGMTR
jgi:hypothetical protein